MGINEIEDKVSDFLELIQEVQYDWFPFIQSADDVEHLLKRGYNPISEYTKLVDSLKITDNQEDIFLYMESRVYIHLMFLISHSFNIKQLSTINEIDQELLKRQWYYMKYTNRRNVLDQGEFAKFYYWLEDIRSDEEELGCWTSLEVHLSEESITELWTNKVDFGQVHKFCNDNFNYSSELLEQYSQALDIKIESKHISEMIALNFTKRYHLHHLLMNRFPFDEDDLQIISKIDQDILTTAEWSKELSDYDLVQIKGFSLWLNEARRKELDKGYWHYQGNDLLPLKKVKWTIEKAIILDFVKLKEKKYEMSEIVSWYADLLMQVDEITDRSVFRIIQGRKFIHEVIYQRKEWLSNLDLSITYFLDQELLINHLQYQSKMTENQKERFVDFREWLTDAISREKVEGFWQE